MTAGQMKTSGGKAWKRAREGATTIVTHNGDPVARVVPLAPRADLSPLSDQMIVALAGWLADDYRPDDGPLSDKLSVERLSNALVIEGSRRGFPADPGKWWEHWQNSKDLER